MEEVTITEMKDPSDSSKNESKNEEENDKRNLITMNIADEDLFRLNLLHNACNKIQEQIEKLQVWPPHFIPTKDKAYFLAPPKSETDIPKIYLEADWHLIGEFRLFTFKEGVPELLGPDNKPGDGDFFEFCWSWAIWGDDQRTKDVKRISKELPESLHKIKDAMFRSPDFKVLRIISAYSFEVLGLEYMYSIYNHELNSRGMFGFKNLNWKPTISFEDLLQKIEIEKIEADNIRANFEKQQTQQNQNNEENRSTGEKGKEEGIVESGSSNGKGIVITESKENSETIERTDTTQSSSNDGRLGETSSGLHE